MNTKLRGAQKSFHGVEPGSRRYAPFPNSLEAMCHQKIGEEDYVRDALRDLGAELAVHKVAMKPGKPLA